MEFSGGKHPKGKGKTEVGQLIVGLIFTEVVLVAQIEIVCTRI